MTVGVQLSVMSCLCAVQKGRLLSKLQPRCTDMPGKRDDADAFRRRQFRWPAAGAQQQLGLHQPGSPTKDLSGSAAHRNRPRGWATAGHLLCDEPTAIDLKTGQAINDLSSRSIANRPSSARPTTIGCSMFLSASSGFAMAKSSISLRAELTIELAKWSRTPARGSNGVHPAIRWSALRDRIAVAYRLGESEILAETPPTQPQTPTPRTGKRRRAETQHCAIAREPDRSLAALPHRRTGSVMGRRA